VIHTKNGFDYPKFDVNASNLVLMPKKTSDGGHYNFIFSLIMFYVRLGEHQKNLLEERQENPDSLLPILN
jgi:hypothetical protein